MNKTKPETAQPQAAQPQAAQPESQDTSNTTVYRYLEPKNVCKFANSPPDLWSYFEKDLRTLLTLKETSTEQAISNLNSSEWQKRYDMGNYKSVADYWKLEKEDFAIFFDYLKKKESGIPCPWEMKPKTAAFIVQFVNGDFHNCKNTGLTDIQCQDSGAKDGHYGFLNGVGGIDKFHAGEKIQAAKEKFNASPAGRTEFLKDRYVYMMGVNSCHELRKNYAIKYIDSDVYAKARNAMKTIENQIKREVPNINTDKVWADAINQYKSSRLGMSIEGNKIDPHNMTKDNKSLCLLASNALIESVPPEAPKKDF